MFENSKRWSEENIVLKFPKLSRKRLLTRKQKKLSNFHTSSSVGKKNQPYLHCAIWASSKQSIIGVVLVNEKWLGFQNRHTHPVTHKL